MNDPYFISSSISRSWMYPFLSLSNLSYLENAMSCKKVNIAEIIDKFSNKPTKILWLVPSKSVAPSKHSRNNGQIIRLTVKWQWEAEFVPSWPVKNLIDLPCKVSAGDFFPRKREQDVRPIVKTDTIQTLYAHFRNLSLLMRLLTFYRYEYGNI